MIIPHLIALYNEAFPKSKYTYLKRNTHYHTIEDILLDGERVASLLYSEAPVYIFEGNTWIAQPPHRIEDVIRRIADQFPQKEYTHSVKKRVRTVYGLATVLDIAMKANNEAILSVMYQSNKEGRYFFVLNYWGDK